MASKIEDYGFLSNLRTAALVSRYAEIDWFCPPRFDSAACFTALLGHDEHGRWALRPTDAILDVQQRYRGDTLILETEFKCEGGSIRVTDYMPIAEGEQCELVRIVEGLEGEVNVEMVLDVGFGYGAYKPWVVSDAEGTRFTCGPDSLTLRTSVPVERNGAGLAAYPVVKKGACFTFQLSWHPSHLAAPPALDVAENLLKTAQYWLRWASRCTYRGAYAKTVMRSLLTLKGLTYEPTGAIVAAPTTSLPEELGGVRNWDYRFCWLRDASLTLDALMIAGYVDEARAFRDYLLRATAGAPEDVQIMYDVAGGRRLNEATLQWLPGYEGSRPVRIGNAASDQFQIDIYGEVLSCLYAGRRLGMEAHEEGWVSLRALLEVLERVWQQPDDGIWEVRGGRRHFTHSKLMAWVAVDRSVKVIEEMGMGGEDGSRLVPHLKGLRARIRAEICERGYNARIKAFTQSYDSTALDASVLLIPHVGFLPANDPRMVSTVAAVERTLLRDGFVLRYDTEHGTDGLPGREGAFLACSFWLADNYAFAGRIKEAERLFTQLLGLQNHLGLLAEEYDPLLKRQLGNFPQAFSHLALIFTAQLIETMRNRRNAVQGNGQHAWVP